MVSEQLLIPVRKCRALGGVFTWPDRPALASVRSADSLPLSQLAGDLKKLLAGPVRIIRDAVSPADVRIRRDPKIAGREAYRLTVGPDGVEILASTDAGAYYAVQTLRDLVQAGGRKIRACVIDDWPDFPRRGVYEDCSRGKVPTVETVKALVERLAHWKVNEFQLYVENVFTFKRHPAIGRGYSPFTPSDILEIQDFCKQHHVRLVGSLTSFGHVEKILQLKDYSHLGELPGYGGYRGGTTLCATDPRAIRLVTDMYAEFVPLFEAEDFNVCCDETWELGRGRTKKLADRVGVGRVYLEFLLKIHGLCEKHGKRMNAWADIILDHPELLGDLPKDIVMLNWEYSANGRRIPQTPDIAAAGLPLVVCPGTSGWQANHVRLANSIENVANFVAMGRRCGAEGVLNTDWGDHGHRNFLGPSMHGFAHGAAHAWNGRAVDDSKFTDLFCRRVLGQTDGRLVRIVRQADRASIVAGGDKGRVHFYHTLVEPLKAPGKYCRPQIKNADPAGCRKAIAILSGLEPAPEAGAGADRFEKLTMQELALATEMDHLGARRALAGANIRAQEAVPTAELLSQADEMRRVARQFQRLWLARNRPSRLADNVTLFARAEREARKLAKR